MAKLENQKPWKVEYAKSARSSCKTCKSSIGKEVLRLGKMAQATQLDRLMPCDSKVQKRHEKIMTATKKGSAVLDQWPLDDIKTRYHVLHIGNDIYDAMLNQTYDGDDDGVLELVTSSTFL